MPPEFERRDAWETYRLLREVNLERVGRLPSEAKVNLAIDMTEAMMQVCVQGMKAQNPDIAEEELIRKLRERFKWVKRWQKNGGIVE
jgi:hypothetical protein